MTLILAHRNRGKTLDITITDAAGEPIVPQSNDKVRIVIGREGLLGVAFAGAELVVDSDAPTAAGSSVTKNSPSSGVNRVRLDATDLAFPAGIWTMFVEYFDNADASEWKVVDRQVFCLRET